MKALLGPENWNRETDEQSSKLKIVLDFPLEVAVRLGNSTRSVGELLQLAVGSVIELDREISEPADLIINGQTIAKGKIVIIGENFGVKINSILKPVERIEQLR